MTSQDGTVRQIGRYEVIRKIATGGMAELFLARFVGPGGFEKRCALKRILPQFAADQTFTRMFLNEARVTAMFDHPNVVQIFELGQDEQGQFFIAMELVNGINLRQLLHLCIERSLSIPPELAAYMMTQALDGLAYAHAFRDPSSGAPLNLVHRDISPQNILVSYEGAVKLVDFGIVKGSSISGETQAGMLKGKISYMSPEQASGEHMDGRSDLFSLGVCLYELCAQERPFQAVNELMTLKAILEKPPTQLIDYVSDVPEGIERAIYKALEKMPDDRYRDARAFQTELNQILRECPVPPTRHMVAEFIQSLTEASTVRFDATKLKIPRRTRTAGFAAPGAPDYASGPPTRAMLPDRAATVVPEPTPTRDEHPLVDSMATDLRAAGLERRFSPAIVALFIASALGGALVVWGLMRQPSPVVVEYVPPDRKADTTPSREAAVDTPPPVPGPKTEPAEAPPPPIVAKNEVPEPSETTAKKKKKRKKKKRTRRATERAVVEPPPVEKKPPPIENIEKIEKVVEKKPAVAMGKVTIESTPRGLYVTEGKKKLGKTPLSVDMPVGAHELVLSSRRLGIRRQLRVRVAEGVAISETVVVPRGTLKVISRPWALVYVNGVERGKTPLQIPAYEGRQKLRLVNPEQGERIQVVDVKGTGEQLVTVKF